MKKSVISVFLSLIIVVIILPKMELSVVAEEGDGIMWLKRDPCRSDVEICAVDKVNISENFVVKKLRCRYCYGGLGSMVEGLLPVGKISDGVFKGCRKLKSVDLSEASLDLKIGKFAFESCENLNTVKLPHSSTDLHSHMEIEVGDDAFFDCPNLTDIIVGEGGYKDSGRSDSYFSINGVLCYKKGWSFAKTLIKYPEGKKEEKYTMPNEINIIGARSFCKSRFLKSLSLSRNVTEIDSDAFKYCKDLKVIVPSDTLLGVIEKYEPDKDDNVTICLHCIEKKEEIEFVVDKFVRAGYKGEVHQLKKADKGWVCDKCSHVEADV